MQPYSHLLKCAISLYSWIFGHVAMTEKFTPDSSVYKKMENLAWTDREYIYHIRYEGFTASLIRFNPVTKEHAPMLFPVAKDERFESFQAIFQSGGRFLILTKYEGKKEKPVYKVFSM